MLITHHFYLPRETAGRVGSVKCDDMPLLPQAAGCLASAWARLAVDVGEANATLILEKEWGHGIPNKVIEAGLLIKARFAHMS